MAGLNLQTMIMGALGGRVAKKAGAKFGLSPLQTQLALTALLPAISSALKKNTDSPQGLQGLVGALQKGRHDRILDDENELDKDETVHEGNAILGHLFGSKDVSRQVADKAAEKSGVGSDTLKKMLPLVAVMAMGSLSKQTKDPSVLDQLASLAGGGKSDHESKGSGGLLGSLFGGEEAQTQEPDNILGSLLGSLGGKEQEQDKKKGAGGLLGNLLDADDDGNTMDDIFGMISKGLGKK